VTVYHYSNKTSSKLSVALILIKNEVLATEICLRFQVKPSLLFLINRGGPSPWNIDFNRVRRSIMYDTFVAAERNVSGLARRVVDGGRVMLVRGSSTYLLNVTGSIWRWSRFFEHEETRNLFERITEAAANQHSRSSCKIIFCPEGGGSTLLRSGSYIRVLTVLQPKRTTWHLQYRGKLGWPLEQNGSS
jgi:hypothetical protein